MKQNGNDTARYGNKSNTSTVVEKVAAAQLNRDGVEAIWLLHLSATQAHVDGYAHAAKLMLEIADSAERLWLARRSTVSPPDKGVAASLSLHHPRDLNHKANTLTALVE
jgi:hypothetical protein